MNKHILKFERKLAKLARLMADGYGESEEAFNLRDEMEQMEYNINDEEDTKFIRELSSDLYMIEDYEILDPAPDDISPFEYEANCLTHNWTRCLEILRYDMPELRNETRAYHRGLIYARLKCYSSAIEFYKYAIKLNKWNITYRFDLAWCWCDCTIRNMFL